MAAATVGVGMALVATLDDAGRAKVQFPFDGAQKNALVEGITAPGPCEGSARYATAIDQAAPALAR